MLPHDLQAALKDWIQADETRARTDWNLSSAIMNNEGTNIARQRNDEAVTAVAKKKETLQKVAKRYLNDSEDKVTRRLRLD